MIYSSMNTPENQSVDSGSFQYDVSEVLTRMRRTFAELIAAVPDEIAKSVDLHRVLRIDRKLSWKIFKVASSPDPVAAGPHVPSPVSMLTFFKAARKYGVPEKLIESAARVASDFEDVVSSHAGDRATFDSMVSSLADDESTEQIDLAHRRLAFRAQRHLYGVQARTKLKLVIMNPSADGNMIDLAKAEGYISMRRLRDGAPVCVSSSVVVDDAGRDHRMDREPIDPVGASHGMALLQEFCSKPLPPFHAVSTGRNALRGELANIGLGNRAAITCVEGHIIRSAVPRYRDEANHTAHYLASVYTPCEVLLVDLLVREDVYGPLTPYVDVEDRRFGTANPIPIVPEMILPLHSSVTYLGKGPTVLHTADVPRYPELGQYIFDRLNWDGDRFDVYRCRIEFPITPSCASLRFDLPEAPSH